MAVKQCGFCARSFATTYGSGNNQRYCGDRCRYAAKDKPRSVEREILTSTCQGCDATFEPNKQHPNRQKYCTPRCRGRHYKQLVALGQTGAATVEKLCEVCGRSYLVELARIGRSRFCSVACSPERVARLQVRRPAIIQSTAEERACIGCEARFDRSLSPPNRQYCSSRCRERTYKRRTKLGQTGAATVEKLCDVCQEPYLARAVRADESRYCSERCRRAALKQEPLFNRRLASPKIIDPTELPPAEEARRIAQLDQARPPEPTGLWPTVHRERCVRCHGQLVIDLSVRSSTPGYVCLMCGWEMDEVHPSPEHVVLWRRRKMAGGEA